jgi:hypothetical protein
LESGYDYVYAGENLAKGFNSSQGVHNAWMASKSHRENILNANYREVGIAVVPGELNGDYVILVVQMFGSLSAEPSEVLPQTQTNSNESGVQSYSKGKLEITYPEDGDILTDSHTAIKGNAASDLYEFKLYDNGEKVTDMICNEGVWDYRPQKPWKEGEHKVEVKDGDLDLSDNVEFIIDTQAPEIYQDSFELTRQDNEPYETYLASIEVTGDPQEVVLMVGNLSKNMSSADNSDNIFQAEIPYAAIKDEDQFSIFTADAAGNNSVVEIPQKVLGSASVDSQGPLSGVKGIFTFNVVKNFNRVLIFAIALLLIIDSIYLLKLNILHTKGKMLFPMVIWVLVLGIGLVIGSGGTVA